MTLHTLRVARVEATGQRFALYAGQPVLAQHGRIDGLLRRQLSPLLASLFARGSTTADGRYLEWYTDLSGQPVPLGQLAGGARENVEGLLRERLGAVRGLGARLAAQGDADAAELLRLICGMPALGNVYVVGGQPVIVGWGLEGTAPAALVEPEPVPAALPRGWRWGRWLWLLVVVLLVALALLGLRHCAQVPSQAAVDELGRLRDEEGALRREIEELERRLAARRASCPKPELKQPPPERSPEPPPPEPRPAPESAPPPPEPPKPKPPKPKPQPKKADLPADRWRKGDLSMLEGCWVLGRDAVSVLGDVQTGKNVRGVKHAERLCLNQNGTGTREMRADYPGRPTTSCSAPVTIWFEGDTLRTRQPKVQCKPSTEWLSEPNWLSCRRVSDTTALCRDGLGFEHEFRREGRH